MSDLSDLLYPNAYKILPALDPHGPKFAPGQLVHAHTAYPLEEPWILQVVHYNRFDEKKCEYRLKRFEEGDRSHIPIAELQLEADEHFYVYKGKERPLVFITMVTTRWWGATKPRDIALCAPIYSFKKRHSPVWRVKATGFCYPELFYLPSHEFGCLEDSVARLDLIQPISIPAMHAFLPSSKRCGLSDEAFAAFVNHLVRYLLGKDLDAGICGNIDAYRELVEEELRQQER